MPIHSTWCDTKKTIFHLQLAGAWTWEEYVRSQIKLIESNEFQTFPIKIIIDFTDSNNKREKTMALFKKTGQEAPQIIEHVVIVGNAFVRAMVTLGKRLNATINYPIDTASSVEDALQLMGA